MKKKYSYTIRNMVCQRCIEAVQEILAILKVSHVQVGLGNVEFLADDTFNEIELKNILEKRGFGIVKSKDEILIEQTKAAIIELVHDLSVDTNITTSIWLENKLGTNYSKISRTFSKYNDLTVEKYIIHHRIEKVKELIQYQELSFESIAEKTGYKNLSHLSKQFKETTGVSLSEYKRSNNERNKLEEI